MTETSDGLTASARKYEHILREQDERIADLERQLEEVGAERNTLERQLALCQKQYAIVEGRATSRKVNMEELRAEVAALLRELAAMRDGHGQA